MFPLATLKLPVSGATATWALAIPALNRGTSFSFSPRFQSTGLLHAVLQVNGHFFVRDYVHVARPNRLALVRHGQVMLPGGSSRF